MMNHKIFYALTVFVFGLMLCGPFVLSANAAPVIMGIEPKRSAPGESIRIFGSDLTTSIELRSPGQTFQVTGSANQSNSEVGFIIPANAPAGEYEIAMIAPGGTYFSDDNLTVVVGGPPFRPGPTLNIPTEGLPGFGQLIAMIFTWSLNILGIVVFVMIFFAGFKWFTAAGNTAKVNEARSQITNAITGAIILLAAWIILYTINPDLVGGELTLPGIGGSTRQTP